VVQWRTDRARAKYVVRPRRVKSEEGDNILHVGSWTGRHSCMPTTRQRSDGMSKLFGEFANWGRPGRKSSKNARLPVLRKREKEVLHQRSADPGWLREGSRISTIELQHGTQQTLNSIFFSGISWCVDRPLLNRAPNQSRGDRGKGSNIENCIRCTP